MSNALHRSGCREQAETGALGVISCMCPWNRFSTEMTQLSSYRQGVVVFSKSEVVMIIGKPQ